eukprot:PhF_6_TR3366/c0_g1_i1/m.4792
MFSSLLLLLCVLLSCVGWGMSFTGLQRDALFELYIKCNGPLWPLKNRANWGTDNVCSWNGIVCDPSGQIISVDMEEENMRCELPESLGNLTSLRVLDISSNLIGTIPTTIRYWTRLERLKLYQNQITGTLPDWLSELRDLREIGIVPRAPCKGLSGTIPSSWGTLPLDTLFLDQNDLSGFVPDWVNHVAIKHLRGNRFKGPCPPPPTLPIESVEIRCNNTKDGVKLHHRRDGGDQAAGVPILNPQGGINENNNNNNFPPSIRVPVVVVDPNGNNNNNNNGLQQQPPPPYPPSSQPSPPPSSTPTLADWLGVSLYDLGLFLFAVLGTIYFVTILSQWCRRREYTIPPTFGV